MTLSPNEELKLRILEILSAYYSNDHNGLSAAAKAALKFLGLDKIQANRTDLLDIANQWARIQLKEPSHA